LLPSLIVHHDLTTLVKLVIPFATFFCYMHQALKC